VIRALLCIPLGHRWRELKDTYEIHPVLRCIRCGRTRELAPGTLHSAPLSARPNACAGTFTGAPTGRDQ